jgi:hypothetical protein
MGQRKTTLQQRVTAELAKRSGRSESMPQGVLYGISPQHPGKLIQRLPDGSEFAGTFQNGKFIRERQDA